MAEGDEDIQYYLEKYLKPRKVVHRPNPHLPPRPKRPPTAYSVFLKKYFTEHRVRSALEARETMKAAAAAWKALPEHEKKRYAKGCEKAQEAYKEVMVKWRRQRNALKQPASSYALFLKATWAIEGSNGRSVGEMGQHISDLWQKLTPDEKKVYQREQQDRADNYYGIMGLLNSGDMNIREIGAAPTVKQDCQNKNRDQAQAQEEAGAEEEMEH